jgi:aldose 1-epimerase
MRRVAELVSTWGDLTMELWSDQPGVHVYTGAGMGRSAPGHPGEGTGVALEPQHFPNSVHHPEWPSTVLRPGEEYEWVAETRFRDVLG